MNSKQRSRGKAWKDSGVSVVGVLLVLGAWLLSPEGAELLSNGPAWLLAIVPSLQWLVKYLGDQAKHKNQVRI